MQTCSSCGETKPDSEYYQRNGRPRGRRCKVCVRKSTGSYQRANRERASELQRRWRLINQFGITAEEYDQLMAVQRGLCAICEVVLGRGRSGAHVDHDHETGKVRGILCGRCNRGLGHLGDTVEGLTHAIAYLERSQA